jgi:ABC-2 type transport system ATP-binding protein
MAWAIETTQLTRRFGEVCAVNALDLRVEAGRFYGFLGPNGAGKSTTIKMLTGLLAPTCGSIRILGETLADPQCALAVKRRLGVVPEHLPLFENLTAREYLTFVGRMYGLPKDTVRARCDELLAMMELHQEPRKLTLEFSHGMKKKLALAAALLPGPDLLFLDEPFEGVDAVASRVLRDMLKRCVARGATVFLTSHVLDRCRHHRPGRVGASGVDAGTPGTRHARRQVSGAGGTRPCRNAKPELVGRLRRGRMSLRRQRV